MTLAPALPRIISILRDGVDPSAPSYAAATIREPRLRNRAQAVPVPLRTVRRAAA
jgi:hypothetical protein